MELTNFGLKQTKTRKMILEILENSTDSLSAEDIYRLLIDEGINLSTVYRTLTSFVERHLVSKEIRNDGKAIYTFIRAKHHHVLICVRCNKKIYLDECPYKVVDEKILEETGFKLQAHNIELYGLCKECQLKESA